jgi:SAM-dependent methyltransferase
MDVLLSSLPRCAHRFLEVGSGHGNYSLSLARQWPGREFVALDIAEIAIEQSILRGRRHGITNVAFLCGDARGLPFGDESFDVVFSEGALCYVDDDQKALTEMARVARPGGRLIVAVPNFQNLLHPLYKCVMGAKYQYGWERSYSPAELRRRAVDLGLSQIEVRGFHPAYSLVRLGGALGHLGKILDIMVVQRLDRMTGRRFSDTFGFYIVLIGQKPGGQDCGVPSLKRAMRWAKSP